MKNKSLIIVLAILLFIAITCTCCIIGSAYYFKGGSYSSQDAVEVKITDGSENANLEWNVIVPRKQFTSYTNIHDISYTTGYIVFKMDEDMFGSQGSGVNSTVSEKIYNISYINGEVTTNGSLPAQSDQITQKSNFTADYPEWKSNIAYKYQVEFSKDGEIYWNVDIRNESEFGNIDGLDNYVPEVYEDYYILKPKFSTNRKTYVFNIRTKKLAWEMELNDNIESGNSTFVQNNNFYFVTEKGGIIKIISN